MSKQAVAGPDILLVGGCAASKTRREELLFLLPNISCCSVVGRARAISKTRCGEYLLAEDRIFGAKMPEFVRRSCSRISNSTQR